MKNLKLEHSQPIEFTRVNSDVNGNPRFVCHYLNFIKSDEEIHYSLKYQIALKRAKQLGGKKYHTKGYGGGIVFQMYSGEAETMTQRINEILSNVKTQ